MKLRHILRHRLSLPTVVVLAATLPARAYETTDPGATARYINSLLNQPMGIPQLNGQGQIAGLTYNDPVTGQIPTSEERRDATALDDFTKGYFPGDGVKNFGPLWNAPNRVMWQMTNLTQVYQQADWVKVPVSMPCDPGALSVSAGFGGSGCGVEFGVLNGVSSYGGPAVRLLRSSDLQTLDIPFVAGPPGYAIINTRIANRFCPGAPIALRCWAQIVYEHTGTGYNMVPTYFGAYKATAIVSQSGTFAANSVITMANAGGGTAVQPTQISVDQVSGGAITAWHISQYGRFTTAPTNGTQASTSVTGGSGSPSVSFTMAYSIPEAVEYIPYNLQNGLPTLTCSALGGAQGTPLLAQQHGCSMTVPTTPWVPHNVTWAALLQIKNGTGNSQLLTSLDGTYGVGITSQTYGVPYPLGITARRCNGIIPYSTPSVFVLAMEATNGGRCFWNNQYVSMGNASTSENATGFILGGANGSAFSFSLLFDVPLATDPDINVIRVGLTAAGNVHSQVRTKLLHGAASMTAGAGQGDSQNYTSTGGFAYRHEVQAVNLAVSGQKLCDEDTNAPTVEIPDYDPYAAQNIVVNVGESNDASAGLSAASIHGCRTHYMRQWGQQTIGYFMAKPALATAVGVSGYANADVVTLVPPAGITCAVPPTVLVAGVGSVAAGVPGGSSTILAPGWCTNYVGTWTSSGGSGTGATWTLLGLPRAPLSYVSGMVPPQCGKWSVQNLAAVFFMLGQDITANLTVPQPAAGCTTQTACTSTSGANAGLLAPGITSVAINNYVTDPVVGFGGALPGPFTTLAASSTNDVNGFPLYPAGSYPLAGGTPSIPFCSATLSYAGDHPDETAAQYMWPNLETAVNSVMFAP